MKRIVLLGMILCMIIGSTGCNNTKKVNESSNSVEVEQDKDTTEQQVEQDNSIEGIQENQENQSESKQEKEIKPLNESDFTVTDGVNTITLDSSYNNFETTETEINTGDSEDNFVGEITVGEYNYKTYFHQFNDFKIYISNTNYPYKNDDQDTYYVTQIDLLSNKFITTRGVYVGAKIDEVLEMYGEGEKISDTDDQEENNDQELIYQFDNYVLSFIYNNEEVVDQISLYVLPIE